MVCMQEESLRKKGKVKENEKKKKGKGKKGTRDEKENLPTLLQQTSRKQKSGRVQ